MSTINPVNKSPSSSNTTTTASSNNSTPYSAESVAYRFLAAILDFMGKNAQNPSEIYQLLAQTGSVLLLQTEEFPKYLQQYIENKFQEADKEFSSNAPMNFQTKYQITVQIFNFATFLQNVRLPAIIPYLSPILTPEEQRKIDFKLSDAPQVKQYDFNHFQEISIAALETLLQSNRSPIQTSDYKESTNCNKTKIPANIASDTRFILMGPKIEIQLASLYLQRSYSPFQVMKDVKTLPTQEFPPLLSHNHEKFYRSNNEDVAMYYLKSALNIVTVQNSPDDFAVCYSQLAHLLKQKKKFDEAIKAFQKVLEVRKPTDTDPTKYASLCMNIANTYLAKIEENKTLHSESKINSAQAAKIILNEYVISLREVLKLEKRKDSSDINNNIKTIDTAIEWFGKSESGFNQLKTPSNQQDKKELSAKDHYLGLVNVNLGYAHLLKTKLYMQLLEEKVDSSVLKTARQVATKAATILKAALEVIKPDLKEKDSILQKTKQMGSESFPKVNIYLAEIYLCLAACDIMEGITDTVNGLDYLEEARSCLDLGATLFMNKDMKEWKVRLNILTFEVYYRISESIIEGLPFILDESNKQQLIQKKEQFTERSITSLREAIKDFESTFTVEDSDNSELNSLIEQLKI